MQKLRDKPLKSLKHIWKWKSTCIKVNGFFNPRRRWWDDSRERKVTRWYEKRMIKEKIIEHMIDCLCTSTFLLAELHRSSDQYVSLNTFAYDSFLPFPPLFHGRHKSLWRPFIICLQSRAYCQSRWELYGSESSWILHNFNCSVCILSVLHSTCCRFPYSGSCLFTFYVFSRACGRQMESHFIEMFQCNEPRTDKHRKRITI